MIIPKIIAYNLIKKQGTGDVFRVRIVDSDNNPIASKSIILRINGVDYNRTTDSDGYARLNINLSVGQYTCTVSVVPDDTYVGVSKSVLVNVVSSKVTPTLFVDNLTKILGTNVPLKARLVYNDNPVQNKTITFTANGIDYNRTTNIDGEVSLNINLNVGSYTVTVTNVNDDTFNTVSKSVTVNVTVNKSTPTLTCTGLTKTYGENTPLTANLSINGQALVNREINININGVDYKRTTDNNGNISLPVNLNAGTYTVELTRPSEQYYDGVTTTATVNINKAKPKLYAYDLEKKYRFPDKYTVELHDIENKPLANRSIDFEINGIVYTRVTDNDGVASLNINLQPELYSIRVTTYDETNYESVTVNRAVRVNKQATRMDGTNITKFAKDTVDYQCAVYNELNERLTGALIHFKVNGIEYTRTTDNEGLAKLPIRLGTGTYTIRAWFSGDSLYAGSSVENGIKVLMNGGTKAKVEEKAEGLIESKIYVGGYPDARHGVLLAPNVMQQLDDFIPNGITFTDYEITETDRRTKTAKFTTPQHLDLTSYFTYVVITSPYHEDFGGVVLSIDYDADKDLYTYQCQDWRRQYMSKVMGISFGNDSNIKIYHFIENTIIGPFTSGTVNIPISSEEKQQYAYALSGLRPLEEYNVRVGALKAQNYMDRPLPQLLSYDSDIDKIFNVALSNSNNLDIWFDKYGIIHLDPIDWDYWLNTGLILTTENMAEYKYGFDTTNILTGVHVKNANDYTTRAFWNNYTYDGGIEKRITDSLSVIYGNYTTVIDGPKTQNTTTDGTSTSTSSSSGGGTSVLKGKRIAVGHDRCGGQDSSRLNQMVNTLKSNGYDAYSLGIGDSVCQNHGLKSSSKGEVCIFICCGICCGTIADFVAGMSRGYYHYDHTIFVFCRNDIDMNKKQSRAHDDNFSASGAIDTSITRHEMFVKHKDKISYVNINDGYSWDAVCQRVVNGQFGNVTGATSSTNTTTTTTNETTQQTVDVNSPDYIAEQYRLAVKEYSKSVRDLMKFTIKIPLNHPLYKNLHTNSFLFTDLPEKFALVNLPKIYKNLASYSVSRGVPYAKNRWYVEQVKIKCDSKGLFADVTLNAFPSDLSSFQSAMDGYISAYDSAFNSTSNTTTTSTTNTTSNNIPARTDGKTHCSAAHALSYVHCSAGQNPARVKTPTANDYGKIGKEGTNYANFVKGCSSPREVFKKLSNAGWNGGNKYRRFSDEAVGSSCADGVFSQGYANCAGMAKLLKACMDVCGFKCAIAHPSGHYMNVVEINGKWESCDLCYQSGKYPGYQSAGFNK